MNSASSKSLDAILEPKEFYQLCKSISAIEAIVCPDWQYRYISFDKNWANSEEVCMYRNGQGDEMFILFSGNGVCINGFDHTSKLNGWKSERSKSLWKKLFGIKNKVQDIPEDIFDGLPECFKHFTLEEPVKSVGTTFCIWYTEKLNKWTIGNLNEKTKSMDDGSYNMLKLFDGNPKTYFNWAIDYYEDEFSATDEALQAITDIYNGEPITREMVLSLNKSDDVFDGLVANLNDTGILFDIKEPAY